MRPLTLHVSALSDNEYDLYTRLFIDLSDDDDTDPRTVSKPRPDAFFEENSVGVREARAFLRGRYADLPPTTVDSILKLFSPDLARNDSLNGNQFFAALRLLSHVRSGAELDPSLAFVQIHPDPHPSRPQSPLKPPPTRAVLPPPPPRPNQPYRRRSVLPDNDGSPDQPAPDAPPPPIPSRPAPTSPQPHKRSVSSSQAAVPPPVSRNPFVGRTKPQDAVDAGPPPALPPKQPPLPPRKPVTLQPPPRHLSISSMPEASTSRKPPPPPVPPPSTSMATLASKTTSLVSPLMQTSLQASKVAKLSRKVEQRQNEPVVHVLKSSDPRPRSTSPNKNLSAFTRSETEPLPPRPPPRRKESNTVITSSSTDSSRSSRANGHDSGTAVFPAPAQSSLVQTNPFKARAEARAQSLSRSPSRPPPLHPDRKANSSGESPTTPTNPRIGRSKSLHHSPTVPPPTPPPRRKRPESVQLTPTNSQDGSPFVTPPQSTDAVFGKLTRHTSLSGRSRRSEPSESSSPLAHIQKTFTTLGERAQPRLEAARIKAEAGLSRKGFIPHHHGAREEASLIRERSMEHIELGSDAEVDSGTDDDLRRGRVAGFNGDDRWAARNEWRPL